MYPKPARFIFSFIILLFILAVTQNSPGSAKKPEGSSNAAPAFEVVGQAAQELVAAVNQLRQSHGLNTLNVHPILMQMSQQQANYMATTGNVTHLSADGKRPFQRALAAGYSVAGDLSLGGFFSENILAGPSLSAQQVVDAWMSDEPHANTMLSPNRSDIGAGIAFSGSYGYYLIDTGLQSSRPIQYTPSSGEVISQDPIVLAPAATSTPQLDGSISHIVGSGETLWTIAAAYQIGLEQITLLNRINRERFIYPGDQLIIRLPQSPTPTIRPTSTPRPRRPTPTPTISRVPAQPVSQPLDNTLVTGLYIFAVIVFGLFVWLEFRSSKNKKR